MISSARAITLSTAILISMLMLASPPIAFALDDDAMPPCRATEAGRALDFWIGEWTVTDGGENVLGSNRIEWDAGGCAVHEFWQDINGNRGTSLFYFAVNEDVWHQVWVTGNTSLPWGLKLKDMIARGADGSVQFQGTLTTREGALYLDRTTMTPFEDGTIRQLIEISSDGGTTWRTTFDALYRRNGEE